jgi:hypothetical protein
MFQTLLGEVRSGVIDRIFRYLPRLVAAENNLESAAPAATVRTASVNTTAAPAHAQHASQQLDDASLHSNSRKRHKKK